MQAIKPYIAIEGDSPDRIMARSGQIVGFTKTRIVWQYGFLPFSDSAMAYGVSLPVFHWVISTYNGVVLDSFDGYALDLPTRYQNIIDGTL